MDDEDDGIGWAIGSYCRLFDPTGARHQPVDPGRAAVLLSTVSAEQVILGRIDGDELLSVIMALAWQYFMDASGGDAEYDARVHPEAEVVQGEDIDGLIGWAAQELGRLNARETSLGERAIAAIRVAACVAATIVDPDVATELESRKTLRDSRAERLVQDTCEECYDLLAEWPQPTLGDALVTLRRLDRTVGPAGLGEHYVLAAVLFGDDELQFRIRDILWLGKWYAGYFAIDYDALLQQFASELENASLEVLRDRTAVDIHTLTEGALYDRAAAAARLSVAMRPLQHMEAELEEERNEDGRV